MSRHQSQCGYCNKTVSDWNRTPHGRKSCPYCKSIPKDDQYTEEDRGLMHTK